jgi:hypothetical protein
MTVVDQQTAPDAPQVAAAVRQMAPSRFNYRVQVGLEQYQVKNIETLRQRMGSSDTAVLRAAVDLLAYVNQLPVQTDPSVWVRNFAVLTQTQNGE